MVVFSRNRLLHKGSCVVVQKLHGDVANCLMAHCTPSGDMSNQCEGDTSKASGFHIDNVEGDQRPRKIRVRCKATLGRKSEQPLRNLVLTREFKRRGVT
jgi:hypothetical protein